MVVGPVGILARVTARARWASLLALVVATGLAGAVVLASVAGSVRGRGALDEFVDHNRPGNIGAFVDPALPPEEQAATAERMIEASGEAAMVAYASVIVALAGPEGPQGPDTDFLVTQTVIAGPALTEVGRPIVVDGDVPLGPGEAAINEFLADRRGVGVGDALELTLFDHEDVNAIGAGRIPDDHRTVQVTVGAVVRQPLDLPQSPQAQPGTIFEADQSRVVLGPRFWEEHGIEAAAYGAGAVGQVPLERRDAIADAMRASGGEAVLVQPAGPDDLIRLESVGAAIDLESNALLAFAAVVGVFGLVVLGSALRRATGQDAEARDILVALGLTTRQVAASRILLGSVVAAAITLLAVAGAVAASPLFPIGLAGDAEVHPGLDVDGSVLVLGGIVSFLLLVGRVALGDRDGRRVAPGGPRPARVPLTGPGALGARLATDGAGGRGGATVRVALVTAVVGVVAVAAAVTYAQSLDRLRTRPELQGWTWDVTVGNSSDLDTVEADRRRLAGNDDVARFQGYNWVTVELDGVTTALLEVDDGADDVLPPVLEGRAPRGDDEVALGRGTLEELDLEIGDTVEIAAENTVPAVIVGEVVAPAVLVPPMDLDSGGVATFAMTSRLFGDTSYPVGFLVDLRDDVDQGQARARLEADFPRTVLGPMQPLDVRDLDRVRSFPFLLAGLLGAMAVVSVVVTLATASRRRRRDIAVFRSLGLDRSQVRRVLAGEASTFVAAALGVGVPIGIVAGRQAWRLAADGLGSEVGPTVPLLVIAAAAVAVLLAVNLYALWLARTVARRAPGRDLRTE